MDRDFLAFSAHKPGIGERVVDADALSLFGDLSGDPFAQFESLARPVPFGAYGAFILVEALSR
jgi:hypothetical protein